MGNYHSPFVESGNEVVIVDWLRTAIGRAHPEKGAFRDTHPSTLLARCFSELIARSGIEAALVDDVIVGCPQPFGVQSRNIARNAWLQAGLPVEVPATTIDRRCGSAQSAIAYAGGLIASGMHEIVIAAGVEHMGKVPLSAPITVSESFGDPWTQELRDRFDFVPQGISAELIAEQWDISRQEMDELSVTSHRLAAEADRSGRLAEEIIPIDTPHGVVTHDQGIRPDTDLESLGSLRTPFKADGRLTAASSSQISDGAGAVLLMSVRRATELGLRPRARILDQVTVGVDPILMLTGPIPATRKLLARTGLSMTDVDISEVNEAFASVVLAWQRELGADMSTVNVNGGAIALGHPVGMTGARLVGTLVNELEHRDKEIGLVTMCCGGGLGTGHLLQRL